MDHWHVGIVHRCRLRRRDREGRSGRRRHGKAAASAELRAVHGRNDVAELRDGLQGRHRGSQRVRFLPADDDHRRWHHPPGQGAYSGRRYRRLQAIGTAKRLGAVVTAYDVRPASKGEVESLGAKFLDLGLDFSKGQGEGGYARALSAEEQAQQQAAVDQKAAGFDIVITTAKVPGRKPPVLLTKAGVAGLHRGAVIVDCAASDLGGNVEGSSVGTQVTDNGVTIIGAPYLASGVSTTASNLLSRNVADVLAHFVRDGKLAIDLNEELDNAMVVAGRGEEAKKEEE